MLMVIGINSILINLKLDEVQRNFFARSNEINLMMKREKYLSWKE